MQNSDWINSVLTDTEKQQFHQWWRSHQIREHLRSTTDNRAVLDRINTLPSIEQIERIELRGDFPDVFPQLIQYFEKCLNEPFDW